MMNKPSKWNNKLREQLFIRLVQLVDAHESTEFLNSIHIYQKINFN